MSNLTLKNHSRVESIKKKFENSLNEGNKTVLSKNSTLSSFQSTEVCSFNKTIPAKNSSDVIKTETSKFDSKAQIKRTPAFRREKIECLKNHNKLPCTDISKQVGKLIKYDCGKEKSEPLPDSSLQNFQRVKTDFLNCDTENATKINSNKSNLASKKISLLANDCSKEILPYAVVNKNCNKPASKIQKETDLKLSESLRKALKLPLPKGPPPKKPPRTFCHVIPSSNSNNPTKVTEVPKDLPKLKSKLEKLENIIKTHDTKLSAKVPNEGFKASLEEKLKIIPKTIESKPLGIVPLKKNGNQNCLQLSSCINLCTDASVYEKLMQKNVCNLDLSKAEPDCNKQNPNEKSTSSFFDDTAVKKSMSEPIYDLPCIAESCPEMCKKLGEKKSETHENNKKEEGLHYLCTDVVNKLSRHKSWEFSSNENRRPGIVSHSLINENINSENLSEKNSKVSCLSGPNRNSNSYNNNNDEGQPLNIRNHLSPYLKDDEDGENIQLENHFIQRDPVSMCGNQGLHRVGTTGFLDLSKGSVESKILSRKTAQRKDYVNRVSSKLHNCVPYWKSIKENNCSHLFECCLLVGLTLESEKNVPYIKLIFPPEVKPPPLIEALCFPDADNWPHNMENDSEEQFYSLVITNENGERKFGYCRRVLPEGSKLCLPLTYCIVTSRRANGFFYKVLKELESRHGTPGLETFIKQLYEAEFPGLGQSLKLKQILEEATKISPAINEDYISSTLVRRPCDVRLEEKNLTQLLQYLPLPVFLKVFSTLLHERKILLLSNSLRKLSSCIEALQSTLLPFSWQHTFIPVLPVYLLEMCEAPTPYIIGLPKSSNFMNSLETIAFDNGIMVDLDDSAIIKCCGDEGTILPQRLIKSLKISLNLAVSSATVSEADRNVLISDAFMNFFVKVCGHYSKFILVCDGQKIFDKKAFIEFMTSATTQSFLECFTQTAMFRAFIDERLNGIVEDVPVKLFCLRATERSSESLKNSSVSAINYKIINKKVKTLSDKIKDFVQ